MQIFSYLTHMAWYFLNAQISQTAFNGNGISKIQFSFHHINVSILWMCEWLCLHDIGCQGPCGIKIMIIVMTLQLIFSPRTHTSKHLTYWHKKCMGSQGKHLFNALANYVLVIMQNWWYVTIKIEVQLAPTDDKTTNEFDWDRCCTKS